MYETVETVLPCDSFCKQKNIDENGNCKPSEKYSSTISSMDQETDKELVDVDGVNKSLRSLKIADEGEEGKKEMYLAGTIINIIPGMNTAIVRPLSPEVLLYLETPLFLDCQTRYISDSLRFRFLGRIDDIFGSIKEPMYSVKLDPVPHTMFEIGGELYCSKSTPNTRLMYVEHTEEQEKTSYKIKTRRM